MTDHFANQSRITGVSYEDMDDSIHGQSSPYERQLRDIEGKDYYYDDKSRIQDCSRASCYEDITDHKCFDGWL